MKFHDEIHKWHGEAQCASLAEKLKKRGFQVEICSSPEEFRKYMSEQIDSEESVGLGGSVSIRELELDTALKEKGNEVLDHWDSSLSAEEKNAVRDRQMSADVFITGINAITREGQIVNIDGVGNRLAALTYGPKKVYAIAGVNKIAGSLDDAMWRIKNIAAPKNAKRLNLSTPCAKTGFCHNCGEETSICRIINILEYKPRQTEYTIVLLPFEVGY